MKRILQVPCNTPYVRKIEWPDNIQIVNGGSIPFDVSFKWLLDHSDDASFWDSFDICHLHYGFEFESFEAVDNALRLIKSKGKPIVFTCHELSSVHGVDEPLYLQYLKRILDVCSTVITLTEYAKVALSQKIPVGKDILVIPHGYVVEPEHPLFGKGPSNNSTPEVLLFGALRNNRDVITTMVNLLADTTLKCRVALATRPFTSNQLTNNSALGTMLMLAQVTPRAELELNLPLTDDEVVSRVTQSNIIVLPYISGGHSGQLELAYDAGLLPVITNVGFMESQCNAWPLPTDGTVPHAIIVNWNDGKHWLYQPRLIQGVRQALDLLPDFSARYDREVRRLFRISEHKKFLEMHSDVYSRI